MPTPLPQVPDHTPPRGQALSHGDPGPPDCPLPCSHQIICVLKPAHLGKPKRGLGGSVHSAPKPPSAGRLLLALLQVW